MFTYKRKFSILLIMIFSGVLLTGCSLLDSDDSGSGSTDSKDCYANGKEVTGNTDLEAVLTFKEDQQNTTLTQFTMEEIVNYQYGMSGINGAEPYYATYELCDVNSGYYLEEGEFVFEGYTTINARSNPNAVSESSGSTTDFLYEVEGVKENSLPGPGTYSINTFSASEEGGEWKLTDSYQFTIVE